MESDSVKGHSWEVVKNNPFEELCSKCTKCGVEFRERGAHLFGFLYLINAHITNANGSKVQYLEKDRDGYEYIVDQDHYANWLDANMPHCTSPA